MSGHVATLVWESVPGETAPGTVLVCLDETVISATEKPCNTWQLVQVRMVEANSIGSPFPTLSQEGAVDIAGAALVLFVIAYAFRLLRSQLGV